MSPNHLTPEYAIDELKRTLPSALRKERSLRRILASRTRPKLLPSLAAAAVTAVALFLGMPARGSGIELAEAVRRTQDSLNLHVSTFDENGKLCAERWLSEGYLAAWGKDGSGTLRYEIRRDERHMYSYLFRESVRPPNGYQYATLWDAPALRSKRSKLPAQTVDMLVTVNEGSVVREASVDGGVRRFTVKLRGDLIDVDARETDGRILMIKTGTRTERFEYPEAIDRSIFSYRSRISKTAPVLDVRGQGEPKSRPLYMPKVIASSNGIQLREVSLSPEGDLLVYWTGHMPDDKARARLHVSGVATGETRWLYYYLDGVHPLQGPPNKRLVCWRVALKEKIGETISVRIPTRTSSVLFTNVHVSRLKPLP